MKSANTDRSGDVTIMKANRKLLLALPFLSLQRIVLRYVKYLGEEYSWEWSTYAVYVKTDIEHVLPRMRLCLLRHLAIPQLETENYGLVHSRLKDLLTPKRFESKCRIDRVFFSFETCIFKICVQIKETSRNSTISPSWFKT